MNRSQIRFESPKRMGAAVLAACRDPNMGGGILTSGASGTGKTNISEWVFLEYVRRGWPAIWFCPHGDSAKKLRRQILLMPERVREKVIYIRVADPNRVVSLRPLHVRRGNLSEYEYRARVMNRVGHMRNLLIASVGEADQGVIGRPLLRKWTTTLLTIGARSGLNVADLMHLLDVTSPVFRLLSQVCPDVVTRAQLQELPDMRPAEREFEISSTRSRLLALFENVVVQQILGRNDDDVLDMDKTIDEGRIVIVDLARDGMLSHDDQRMIANLYLSEFLHCVMERRAEDRRDYLCCIDELPVFDLSAKLIHDLLTEIRKFRTKFWLSFQGSSRFPGRHENEFLQTIVDQCRVQIYLGHGANDAKFFAQELALSSYDARRIKHEQYTQQQLHDGYEVRTLVDESVSTREDESFGTAEGMAINSEENWGEQSGVAESTQREINTLRRAVNEAKSVTEAEKASESKGGSHGQSQTTTTTTTRTRGRSKSKTHKQTLVPIYKMIESVSGVQFFTPEEWTLTIARSLTTFAPGECALYVRGHGVCYGRLPLSVDRMARTPRSAARRVSQHDAVLDSLPYYASPQEIEQDRQVFLRGLLNRLRIAVSESDSERALARNGNLFPTSDRQLMVAGTANGNADVSVLDIAVEEPVLDAPWDF